MKILFSTFFIIITSLAFYAQDETLPIECKKILKENFPSFRYDSEWDYENVRNFPAAFSADFNGDRKSDYGVFIQYAGKKLLVIFTSARNSFKFTVVERDAVLNLNSSELQIIKTENEDMETKFFQNLPKNFNVPKDDFGMRILKEYGALFVAKSNVIVPNSVIFKDHSEVAKFQERLSISRDFVGRFEIELQTVAMNSLGDAIAEAGDKNLTITTRDYDSGRRSYGETIGLWLSRVEPALEYWTQNEKIYPADAERLRKIPLSEQIAEIFKLEEKGIYFSKDLSKPIMYSVAPPGTSQHLSLLAIDINEYDDQEVINIMARNGWHQTVISDLPHFTYLGADESRLSALGLKKSLVRRTILLDSKHLKNVLPKIISSGLDIFFK